MPLFLSVLLVGGAVGLAMPGGPLGKAVEQPESTAQTDAKIATVTPAAPSEWSRDLTLPRQPDGHFYAAVTVSNREFPMLVDTGASMVALTADDAWAMGLDWKTSSLSVVAQGAGGPVQGVQTTIPHMRVGEHEAHDVYAVIIPEGLQVSLLGQSFLSTIENVQVTRDSMILGRHP